MLEIIEAARRWKAEEESQQYQLPPPPPPPPGPTEDEIKAKEEAAKAIAKAKVMTTVPKAPPGSAAPYYVDLVQRQDAHCATASLPLFAPPLAMRSNESARFAQLYVFLCRHRDALFPADEMDPGDCLRANHQMTSLPSKLVDLGTPPLSAYWSQRQQCLKSLAPALGAMCMAAAHRSIPVHLRAKVATDYRPRIYNVCLAYLPHLLHDLDALCLRVAGHEEEFMATMVAQFGPEPPLTDDVVMTQSTEAAKNRRPFRERVTAMMEKYAPQSVSKVDGFVAKYEGTPLEEKFIVALVEKYGPEPPPPKSEAPPSRLRSVSELLQVAIATARNAATNAFVMAEPDGAPLHFPWPLPPWARRHLDDPAKCPTLLEALQEDASLAATSATTFVNDRGFVVHVWKSASEGRRFVASQSRLAQAVFDSQVAHVAVPFTFAGLFETCFVTATAFAPLCTEDDETPATAAEGDDEEAATSVVNEDDLFLSQSMAISAAASAAFITAPHDRLRSSRVLRDHVGMLGAVMRVGFELESLAPGGAGAGSPRGAASMRPGRRVAPPTFATNPEGWWCWPCEGADARYYCVDTTAALRPVPKELLRPAGQAAAAAAIAPEDMTLEASMLAQSSLQLTLELAYPTLASNASFAGYATMSGISSGMFSPADDRAAYADNPEITWWLRPELQSELAVDASVADVTAALKKGVSTVASAIVNELQRKRATIEGCTDDALLDICLREGLCAKVFHKVGINMRFLGVVAGILQGASAGKPTVVTALVLLKNEMVLRALKAMLRAELWSPAHSASIDEESPSRTTIARLRADLTSRTVAALLIRGENQFSQVVTIVQRKFAPPPVVVLQYSDVQVKAVAASLTTRLALVVDAQTKKFSGFNIYAKGTTAPTYSPIVRETLQHPANTPWTEPCKPLTRALEQLKVLSSDAVRLSLLVPLLVQAAAGSLPDLGALLVTMEKSLDPSAMTRVAARQPPQANAAPVANDSLASTARLTAGAAASGTFDGGSMRLDASMSGSLAASGRGTFMGSPKGAGASGLPSTLFAFGLRRVYYTLLTLLAHFDSAKHTDRLVVVTEAALKMDAKFRGGQLEMAPSTAAAAGAAMGSSTVTATTTVVTYEPVVDGAKVAIGDRPFLFRLYRLLCDALAFTKQKKWLPAGHILLLDAFVSMSRRQRSQLSCDGVIETLCSALRSVPIRDVSGVEVRMPAVVQAISETIGDAPTPKRTAAATEAAQQAHKALITQYAEALVTTCGVAMMNEDLKGSTAMRRAAALAVEHCETAFGLQDDHMILAITYLAFFTLNEKGHLVAPGEHADVVQHFKDSAIRLHFASAKERDKMIKADWFTARIVTICEVLTDIGELPLAETLTYFNADIAIRTKNRANAKRIAQAVEQMQERSETIARLQKRIHQKHLMRGPRFAVSMENVHRQGVAYLEWLDRRDLAKRRFTHVRMHLVSRMMDDHTSTWAVVVDEITARSRELALEWDQFASQFNTVNDGVTVLHQDGSLGVLILVEFRVFCLEGYKRMVIDDLETSERDFLKNLIENFELVMYSQDVFNERLSEQSHVLEEVEVWMRQRAEIHPLQLWPIVTLTRTQEPLWREIDVEGAERVAWMCDMDEPLTRFRLEAIDAVAELSAGLQGLENESRQAIDAAQLDEFFVFMQENSSFLSANSIEMFAYFEQEQRKRIRQEEQLQASRFTELDEEYLRRVAETEAWLATYGTLWLEFKRRDIVAQEQRAWQLLIPQAHVSEFEVVRGKRERQERVMRRLTELDELTNVMHLCRHREAAERRLIDLVQIDGQRERLEAHEAFTRKALREALDPFLPTMAFISMQEDLHHRNIIFDEAAAFQAQFFFSGERLERQVISDAATDGFRRLRFEQFEGWARSHIVSERRSDLGLFVYLQEMEQRRRLVKVLDHSARINSNHEEAMARVLVGLQWRRTLPLVIFRFRKNIETDMLATRATALLGVALEAEVALRLDTHRREAAAARGLLEWEAQSVRAAVASVEEQHRGRFVDRVVADVRQSVLLDQALEWIFLRQQSELDFLHVVGVLLIAELEAKERSVARKAYISGVGFVGYKEQLRCQQEGQRRMLQRRAEAKTKSDARGTETAAKRGAPTPPSAAAPGGDDEGMGAAANQAWLVTRGLQQLEAWLRRMLTKSEQQQRARTLTSFATTHGLMRHSRASASASNTRAPSSWGAEASNAVGMPSEPSNAAAAVLLIAHRETETRATIVNDMSKGLLRLHIAVAAQQATAEYMRSVPAQHASRTTSVHGGATASGGAGCPVPSSLVGRQRPREGAATSLYQMQSSSIVTHAVDRLLGFHSAEGGGGASSSQRHHVAPHPRLLKLQRDENDIRLRESRIALSALMHLVERSRTVPLAILAATFLRQVGDRSTGDAQNTAVSHEHAVLLHALSRPRAHRSLHVGGGDSDDHHAGAAAPEEDDNDLSLLLGGLGGAAMRQAGGRHHPTAVGGHGDTALDNVAEALILAGHPLADLLRRSLDDKRRVDALQRMFAKQRKRAGKREPIQLFHTLHDGDTSRAAASQTQLGTRDSQEDADDELLRLQKEGDENAGHPPPRNDESLPTLAIVNSEPHDDDRVDAPPSPRRVHWCRRNGDPHHLLDQADPDEVALRLTQRYLQLGGEVASHVVVLVAQEHVMRHAVATNAALALLNLCRWATQFVLQGPPPSAYPPEFTPFHHADSEHSFQQLWPPRPLRIRDAVVAFPTVRAWQVGKPAFLGAAHWIPAVVRLSHQDPTEHRDARELRQALLSGTDPSPNLDPSAIDGTSAGAPSVLEPVNFLAAAWSLKHQHVARFWAAFEALQSRFALTAAFMMLRGRERVLRQAPGLLATQQQESMYRCSIGVEAAFELRELVVSFVDLDVAPRPSDAEIGDGRRRDPFKSRTEGVLVRHARQVWSATLSQWASLEPSSPRNLLDGHEGGGGGGETDPPLQDMILRAMVHTQDEAAVVEDMERCDIVHIEARRRESLIGDVLLQRSYQSCQEFLSSTCQLLLAAYAKQRPHPVAIWMERWTAETMRTVASHFTVAKLLDPPGGRDGEDHVELLRYISHRLSVTELEEAERRAVIAASCRAGIISAAVVAFDLPLPITDWPGGGSVTSLTRKPHVSSSATAAARDNAYRPPGHWLSETTRSPMDPAAQQALMSPGSLEEELLALVEPTDYCESRERTSRSALEMAYARFASSVLGVVAVLHVASALGAQHEESFLPRIVRHEARHRRDVSVARDLHRDRLFNQIRRSRQCVDLCARRGWDIRAVCSPPRQQHVIWFIVRLQLAVFLRKQRRRLGDDESRSRDMIRLEEEGDRFFELQEGFEKLRDSIRDAQESWLTGEELPPSSYRPIGDSAKPPPQPEFTIGEGDWHEVPAALPWDDASVDATTMMGALGPLPPLPPSLGVVTGGRANHNIALLAGHLNSLCVAETQRRRTIEHAWQGPLWTVVEGWKGALMNDQYGVAGPTPSAAEAVNAAAIIEQDLASIPEDAAHDTSRPLGAAVPCGRVRAQKAPPPKPRWVGLGQAATAHPSRPSAPAAPHPSRLQPSDDRRRPQSEAAVIAVANDASRRAELFSGFLRDRHAAMILFAQHNLSVEGVVAVPPPADEEPSSPPFGASSTMSALASSMASIRDPISRLSALDWLFRCDLSLVERRSRQVIGSCFRDTVETAAAFNPAVLGVLALTFRRGCLRSTLRLTGMSQASLVGDERRERLALQSLANAVWKSLLQDWLGASDGAPLNRSAAGTTTTVPPSTQVASSALASPLLGYRKLNDAALRTDGVDPRGAHASAARPGALAPLFGRVAEQRTQLTLDETVTRGTVYEAEHRSWALISTEVLRLQKKRRRAAPRAGAPLPDASSSAAAGGGVFAEDTIPADSGPAERTVPVDQAHGEQHPPDDDGDPHVGGAAAPAEMPRVISGDAATEKRRRKSAFASLEAVDSAEGSARFQLLLDERKIRGSLAQLCSADMAVREAYSLLRVKAGRSVGGTAATRSAALSQPTPVVKPKGR